MSDEITEIEIDNSAEMEALRAEKILLEAQVSEFENAQREKAEEERTELVDEATTLGMKGHEDLSTETLVGLIASWSEAHPVIEEEIIEMKPVEAAIDEPIAPVTPSEDEKMEVVSNFLNKERMETPKAVYATAYNTWVSAWNRTLTPAESDRFKAKSFEEIRGE